MILVHLECLYAEIVICARHEAPHGLVIQVALSFCCVMFVAVKFILMLAKRTEGEKKDTKLDEKQHVGTRNDYQNAYYDMSFFCLVDTLHVVSDNKDCTGNGPDQLNNRHYYVDVEEWRNPSV